MSLGRWWRKVRERWSPARRVRLVDGDSLPDAMPGRSVVVARDDGELWCAGMLCPCGCGEVLELALIAEARPRWSIRVDRRGRPSLSPSVWRRTGCRSHFWLRDGRVSWVD